MSKKMQIPRCYNPQTMGTYPCLPDRGGNNEKRNQTMSSEFVQKQMALLEAADDATVESRYRELVPTSADSQSFGRSWMLHRIAYALQSAATGDKLTEQEEQMIAFLATKDWRCNPCVKKPMKNEAKPTRGSRFVRSYKGKDYEMQIDSLGRFVYEGRVYKSATSIAREITGSHVNGKIWWGLRKEV